MEEIHVEVQQDYLERMASTRQPIMALAELIWNGFDADADRVTVTVEENGLGGIERIMVTDNGDGIPRGDATPAFKNLGGSLKKNRNRSKREKRSLHGQSGKGRFKSFSLGGAVEWRTRYRDGDKLIQYSILGHKVTLGCFKISDPSPVESGSTGTSVIISSIEKNFRSLKGEVAIFQIAQLFAFYLREYPHVGIEYDGTKIDPSVAELARKTYSLGEIELENGSKTTAELTVIEWRVEAEAERVMLLCDEKGFALGSVSPGIKATGFIFTAYLRSPAIRELDNDGSLVLEELSLPLGRLLEPARNRLKEHFRARHAEVASDRVKEWKQEDIYPYSGEATGVLEIAERQMFDVLALNVHEYLPGFDKEDIQARRFSLRLLKQAIENSPAEVQKIVQEVLNLPLEQQRDLADLLEKTSLSAIVNASKTVADRLEFLRGLQLLVFDPASEQELLERSQLHRYLAVHTWIFGDQFTLTVDDQSLTEVLRSHLRILGRDPKTAKPVKTADGKVGIVDLMLSKRVPMPNPEEREHLVVELKRPKQKVTSKEADQILEYAVAVAEDKQFRDVETRWVFWVISNELDANVRRRVKQRHRPQGLLHDDEERRIFVWVKTWGEVINSCRGRFEFFQKHFAYDPDHGQALKKLQEVHAKLLPPSLSSKVP